VSGPDLVLGLLLDVAAAVLGYALSEGDRRKLGRTPWGLPSPVWALIWFLAWFVGLPLYLFAHRAEVRRAAQGPSPTFDAYGRMDPVAPSSSAARSSGSDFPAYPRRADGVDRRSPDPAATPVDPVTPPPPAPPGAAAPPSWQPDPSGRFHYRWWTGSEWTSYVATHGQVVVDGSPDQRIGPYHQT